MRLIFIGDSTMQQNFVGKYPQCGWPQAMPLFLKNEVEIYNFGKNGCSTKSYLELGLFNKALEYVNEESYCFIEFGHNDQKIQDSNRYTRPFIEYYDNLVYFIKEIQKRNGNVILLTPIYRRIFKDNKLVENTHLNYPEAMKKVANDLNIFLIDLTSLTFDLISDLGDEKSKKLFMNFKEGLYENYPNGLEDNTHLRFEGAFQISKLVVNELIKVNHPIIQYLQKDTNL